MVLHCTAAFYRRKVPLVLALIVAFGLITVIRLHGDVQHGRVKCSDQEPQYQDEKDEEQPTSKTDKSSESDEKVTKDWANLKRMPQARDDGSNDSAVFTKIYVKDEEIRDVVKYARQAPLGTSKRDYNNMSTVAKILQIEINENMSALELFQLNIGQYDLYRKGDENLPEAITDLRKLKIKSSEQHEKGTQFKLIFTFENDDQAMFKPMRFPREIGTWENHFYFSDFERHYSEIASYHLDRILGFRRAVPITGRYISIKDDVDGKTSEGVQKTIFTSPAKNLCMVGKCKYYCDTGHAICGHPEKVEGSFAAYLPPFDEFPVTRFYSPYRRSYSRRKKAKWEGNPKYCEEKVLTNSKYNSGRLLLDMIDMYIFDFLTGNMDRHHMEYFTLIEPEPYLIHLDHGRGFGKPHHDDLSILTPLTQCCIIRLSTLKTLVSFQDDKKLSDRMRKAMADDPAAPILLEEQLEALDRRVKVILREVHTCARHIGGVEEVVSDDGY